MQRVNPYPTNMVSAFLCLLHIIKCTLDWIFFMEASNMNYEQTVPMGTV